MRLFGLILSSLLFVRGAVERIEAPPLLCLVVMVKNGGEAFRRVLEVVRPVVDSWVVLDTGSTDGSQNAVAQILPPSRGLLVEEQFVDFATSRNRALQLAETTFATFTLFLDDSFVVHGGNRLRHFLSRNKNLVGDALLVQIRGQDFSYFSCRIFRVSAKIRYTGKVHEVPDCDCTERLEESVLLVEDLSSDTLLLRSKERWSRDKIMLESEWKQTKSSRALFYLGQTLELQQDHETALGVYIQRGLIDDGFREEQALAWSRAGIICLKMGMSFVRCSAYLWSAFLLRPHRTDSLYYIAKNYWDTSDFATCFWISKFAWRTARLSDDILFVSLNIFETDLPDLVACCGYFAGSTDSGTLVEAAFKAYLSNPQDARLRHNWATFRKLFGSNRTTL